MKDFKFSNLNLGSNFCSFLRKSPNAQRSGEHGCSTMGNLSYSGHSVKPGQINFAEGCLGKGPWI